MKELILTILFLLGVTFSAAKLNTDFGQRGELAYIMLFIIIAILAAAVGVAL